MAAGTFYVIEKKTPPIKLGVIFCLRKLTYTPSILALTTFNLFNLEFIAEFYRE